MSAARYRPPHGGRARALRPAGELAAADVVASSEVRGFFQALLDALGAAGTGGATRPARLLVLAEPQAPGTSLPPKNEPPS
ncbi:MAG TPA: hypothetical protein VFR90_01610 [Methylibium sp.]|uniref:hypothetical protein n=1 Tax=Methylibium sp. TaxID=2067992 RepID=UPI002DBF5C9C|nr:hypothetical protein [Methylibium sp.]HEU4457801.1 hypothetical protein [Methylibium sp.]